MPKGNGDETYPVVIFAASIGSIFILSPAFSIIRSLGIQLWFFFQPGKWAPSWARFMQDFWMSYRTAATFFAICLPIVFIALAAIDENLSIVKRRAFAISLIVIGFVGLAARPKILAIIETLGGSENFSGLTFLFGTCLGAGVLVSYGLFHKPETLKAKPVKSPATNEHREPVGSVQVSQKDGFPLLVWVQEVGTGATMASEHSRIGMKMWGCLIVGAAAIGLLFGGFGEMFFFGALAAFLGSFGMRGVHASYSNGGIQYSGLTEKERNDETIPMTKREDCEAWVQMKRGEPVFHLARGDRLAGPLKIVAEVPLRELGSFETSTHSAWLRSPTEIDKRRDWGVIINETSSSGVVVIAEWVHAPRWLTELRGMLSKSFDGVERERILAAAEEAKREATKRSTASSDPVQEADTAGDKPKRRF